MNEYEKENKKNNFIVKKRIMSNEKSHSKNNEKIKKQLLSHCSANQIPSSKSNSLNKIEKKSRKVMSNQSLSSLNYKDMLSPYKTELLN